MRGLDRIIMESIAAGSESMSAAVSRGWSYSQILDGVARLQTLGLVVRTEGQLVLSTRGQAALEAAKRMTFPKPRISTRVERLPSSAVYVPSEAALEEIRESVSTARQG